MTDQGASPENRTPKKRRSRKQLIGPLPVLPLRDQVYYPNMVVSLLVGREMSVNAVNCAWDGDRDIILLTQEAPELEDPEPDDLYRVGVVAHITQLLQVPDGTVRIMVDVMRRVFAYELFTEEHAIFARAEVLREIPASGDEVDALIGVALEKFEHIVHTGRQIPPEALMGISSIGDAGRLSFAILGQLSHLPVDVRQHFLDMDSDKERLEGLVLILRKEEINLELQRQIRARVEKEIGDNQREIILREHLKAIQDELKQHDDRSDEMEEYRSRIQSAGMSPEAQEHALRELSRLERTPFGSPEGTVIRTYLDWLLALPWSRSSEDRLDIAEAARVLDEDHYGLEKVKERILEYLAVRRLAGTRMKGPILCFVGPPGVGKTSIGRSIARALGREFVRVSLGGVRDEAEIRGHRRTYVGALPGRIMQGIRRVAVRNPVFMLDEIDKLGMDFRGDPSSALLEALDPEQNSEFSDHYIELPFDLSEVMFITTANVLDTVPPALRDRMEVLQFPGYTELEKLAIARQFLCPKQIRENGLSSSKVRFDDTALVRLIREYTREAGVRNLEREIASLCRKVARSVAEGACKSQTIKGSDLQHYLGSPRYRYGTAGERDEVGAATGLVYTEAGGDVVTVEVSLIPGQEPRLTLTGQLGEVMRESAQTALTCVRERAARLGTDHTFGGLLDVHVHVPAGAVPKDGPSAGITIAAAIASAATGIPVRSDCAMTGEITLRGKVLPVGGVKEKILGAHRAGLRTVILPAENERDLEDVPEAIRKEMRFELVETVDDVLRLALAKAAG